MGLRLMVFDRTDRWRIGVPRLSAAWRTGAALYRGLGRLDDWFGVSEWTTALDWLASHRAAEPIDEIQFWGHGNWGCVKVDGDAIGAASLEPNGNHHRQLCAIRERMTGDSLWWFRACETFGAEPGHDFARRWTDFFGCRAAGHTHIIGTWQSGLHSLAPGERPRWSTDEGLAAGTPAEPEKARGSRPWRTHTISCFRATIPVGY